MSEGIVESIFFKITKYPRVNVFDKLPGLHGVQQLTKYEIRKDLRDIERSFFNDDTDSDSSVKSEDILASSYPVKPRRTQRLANRMESKERQLLDIDKDRATIAAADEALNFLRAIKVSKAELHNAEVERERLEALQMSYEKSIADKIAKFSPIKKEQENYAQLLQALFTKYLRQNVAYGKQNVMIYDILEAMQRRRQAADIMDTESKKLKSSLQGKISKITGNQKQPIIEGETAFLRVHLQKANKEVILYKGQWIKTPMGIGQVISIQPGDHRVTIQLPFGKMYSCLQRAVCWGGINDRLDISSDKSLCSVWNSSKNINIPIEKRLGIRKLIGRVEDSDDFTDQDDDNSSDQMGQADGTTSANSLEDNAAMQVLHNALSQDTRAMEVSSADMIESDADIALSERLLASVGLDFMNGGKKIFPLPSGLTANQTTENGRQKIRKSLYDDILTEAVNIKTLPLAFAPTVAIPAVVEAFENPKREHRIEFCKQALQSRDTGKLGTTGSLTWTGSVEDMTSTLQLANKGISKLENEVKDYMMMAQSNSSHTLRLMKEISSIRLAMFTKRIGHRNNLGNHASSLAFIATSNGSTSSGQVKEESNSNGSVIKKENGDKTPSHSTSPLKDIEAAGQPSATKKRSRDQVSTNENNSKKSEKPPAGKSMDIAVENNSDSISRKSSKTSSNNEGISFQESEAIEIEEVDSKKKVNGSKRAKK